VNQSGHLVRYSKSGVEAKFGKRGELSQVRVNHHESQMLINHGLREHRTIEVVRSDRRIVNQGRGRGFVERQISSRSSYVSRSYVIQGRPLVRVYQTYIFAGITFYRYIPVAYYPPEFYLWIDRPWRVPVAYVWDWEREPWTDAYHGYFTPESSYSSPELWLADYLIAENLRNAFYESAEADQNAGTDAIGEDNATNAALDAEVKQAFTEEVASEVRDIQSEASSAGTFDDKRQPAAAPQVPPVLDPKHRFTLVSMNVEVTTSTGETCSLTGGDLIVRTSDEIIQGDKIQISVLRSKRGDCPYSTTAEIEVSALQEMHNETRAQMHTGISVIANKQGSGGMPIGPNSTLRAVPAAFATADANAGSELQKVEKESDQVEAEVKSNTSTTSQVKPGGNGNQ